MTDPIREQAIEAAAKAIYEGEINGTWEGLGEKWRPHYRRVARPLVDAVLAVAGPALRAEALRDAANADSRGYYMADEWERFLRDRAAAETGGHDD